MKKYQCYKSLIFCEDCKRYCFLESKKTKNTISHRLINLREFKNVTNAESTKKNFEICESSLHSSYLKINCKNCNESNVAIVDYPIARAVLLFNSLGYGTAFSCAGHTPYENSYILFSNSENYVENNPPLTKGQRLIIKKIYQKLINEAYDFGNMLQLTYQKYDSESGIFIDIPFEEDDGKLSIDFMYLENKDFDEDTEIDIEDYEMWKRFFWNFINDIAWLLYMQSEVTPYVAKNERDDILYVFHEKI